MTEKERRFGNEDPDAENVEQADEESQAHRVAQDAMLAPTNTAEDSERGGHADRTQVMPDDVPDLVERMREMARSGRIDMDAFEGEENMDDEDGSIAD